MHVFQWHPNFRLSQASRHEYPRFRKRNKPMKAKMPTQQEPAYMENFHTIEPINLAKAMRETDVFGTFHANICKLYRPLQ